MNTDYHVAIIGSGPAGATAAMTLAEAGIKTLLLEKESLPRRKVCAGGLVKRAAMLLPDDLEYPIESICETFESRVFGTDIRMSAQRKELIRMVDRRKFDHALVKHAVNKGTVLREQSTVTQVMPRTDHVLIELGEEQLTARYLILAEGAKSRITNRFWGRQPAPYPALEADIYPPKAKLEELQGKAIFDLDAIEMGYGWVFAREDHLSVGLVTYQDKKLDLHGAFHHYLQSYGLLEGCEVKNKKGFIIPVKQRPGPFMKQRMIIVGDAAGFADPISAEGLSYAIGSGKYAAQAIIEGNDNPEQIGKLYQQKIEDPILKELKAAERFINITYRFKKLRNMAMKWQGKRFQRGMAGVIEGRYRFAEITSPLKMVYHLFRPSRKNSA